MEKDYKKMYEDALKRAMNLALTNNISALAASEIFPELKESEDEKIRKDLKFYLEVRRCQTNDDEEYISCNKFLSWLENQGKQEQLYIRFGEIPTDEKSKIFNGEIEVGTENGVSVYPAFKTSEGDIVLGLNLPITKTTLYTQQHLIEYDDRPCYLVRGDYVGKDTDGQPLINNVSIIEKIDTYRVKEKKQNEYNHILSEEDEEALNNIITAFKRIGENCEHYFSPDTAKVFEKTLESLKDKIQPKQEWSEKDEQMLTRIIDEIEAIKSNSSTIFEKNIAQEKIDWLKSIKPQQNQYDKGFNDGFSASEYNKILTEEDIMHIDYIIGCLEEFTKPGFPIYKGGVFKEIKWLENLKNNK